MVKKTWFLFFMVVMACFASFPTYSQVIADNAAGDNAGGQESIDGASSDNTSEDQPINVVDEAEMKAGTISDVEETAKVAGLPNEKDSLNKFQKMRAEIQRQIRQRFFARAEILVENMRREIKSSKITDERKQTLMASLERRERHNIYSAQGQYQKAANAIRAAMSIKAIKSDTGALLKTEEKVSIQKNWFEIRASYEKDLRGLLEGKQPLLKEKLAIVKQMDSKKKLSDAELNKLQTSLKAINARLSVLNKKIAETHRVFAVKRDKITKASVILNAEQQRKLFPLVMQRMMVRFGNYNLKKQIARHLTNIAEDTEVSWKNLKENFASLQKLQEKVWDLRKQLDVLSGKAPLTEADYRQAKILRDQLERAMTACEKLFNNVEDAFIDQKVFGKLSAKEKEEFVKLFRAVWNRDKEFEGLKPSLEELYNKIFERPIVIDDPKPQPKPEPKPEPGKPSIEGEGFIIQEGNVFLLKFGDKTLWPNNLPARYMVNKLEVKFGAEFILRALPAVENSSASMRDEWWKKYPEISFTYIHAPQLPDEPMQRNDGMATPTQVIEENLDNQNKPANLMNAF
ncbi:MAG: hypothetical protein PHD82_02340 [Candidatus Riflebacteria bacterium]|nr:hypothetical protein [Candidatus Riflebacteria bacterium]